MSSDGRWDTQAEAVERLGFAGLLQKCPVEFIRLVESVDSVGLPEGVRGECAKVKRGQCATA